MAGLVKGNQIPEELQHTNGPFSVRRRGHGTLLHSSKKKVPVSLATSIYMVYMGVSKNKGIKNPIKMDDLGVPRFSETSIYTVPRKSKTVKDRFSWIC